MADNLSGTWKLEIEVGGESGTAVFRLVQGEGGTLSGSYSGRLGQKEVSGIVENGAVEFGFDWHAGKVIYRGTHADGQLTGTCSYGAVGEGRIEGRKTVE